MRMRTARRHGDESLQVNKMRWTNVLSCNYVNARSSAGKVAVSTIMHVQLGLPVSMTSTGSKSSKLARLHACVYSPTPTCAVYSSCHYVLLFVWVRPVSLSVPPGIQHQPLAYLSARARAPTSGRPVIGRLRVGHASDHALRRGGY